MRKNIYYIVAGAICLLIAIIHTIGGQLTLVNPLMDSTLESQIKTEWLGAWHMITILLWMFSYHLISNRLKYNSNNRSLLTAIAWLNFLFALSFIVCSLLQGVHAPQYILFLPTALLTLLGNRRAQQKLPKLEVR